MHSLRSKIESLGQLALAHLHSNKFEECRALIMQILKLSPDDLNALQLYGYLLSVQGDFLRALEIFRKVENKLPNNLGNLINIAKCNYELKRFKDAVNYYLKALKIKPNFPEILMDIGNSYKKLGNFKESLKYYDLASEQGANNVDIYLNKSNLLLQMGDIETARNYCESLIQDGIRSISLFNTYGNILSESRSYKKSLESFEKAISLDPKNAESYAGKGNLYFKMGLYEDAIIAYEDALKLDPSDYVTHVNVGYIFLQLGMIEEAKTSFSKAISMHSNFENLHGVYIYAKLLACDWSDMAKELDIFIQKVSLQADLVANPFTLLAVTDDAQLLLDVSKKWTIYKYPIASKGPIKNVEDSLKIKVGYYSADFRQHPVAQSIVSLLEHHNKTKFEIFGFSYGNDDDSVLRKRIVKACDEFIDVKDFSDQEIVSISRKLKIDIAIDLGGHTQNNRMGIFALKAAPVQINYLGYPGTTGSIFYDYIVADRFIVPQESEKFYTEKIAYLPYYQPRIGNRESPNRTLTREHFGIKQESFVYCCFNNSYKINPAQLDIWAKILKQTDKSVLWLFESNGLVLENLTKEFQERGISKERLHFAQRLERYADHLARYSLADIFLDTFPYCAHTTVSDAIWSGLPVITKKGKSFQSRVAYSVLEMMELQNCAVDNDNDYISLASQLAVNPNKLNNIKNKIEINKKKLTDISLYTQEVELLYKKIFTRYLEGKNTKSIQIDDCLNDKDQYD